MTLSFNLGGRGACRWCWSTSSIHIPALKFLGLTVRKIWPYLCVCVSRPVTLTFDLWPFDPETGAQCSTCHGVTSCQFWWYCDYSFSIYGPLGQHGSDWSRDLVTLIFDLGGHGTCGWCGSSSYIRIPSLKFIRLAIREVWRTICVSINGPDHPRAPLTFWPWNWYMGNLPSKFGRARPLGSEIIRYVRNGRTDGQKDGQKQRLLPPSLRAGGIINCSFIWKCC